MSKTQRELLMDLSASQQASGNSEKSLSYRPDIDGLRAIAVVSVIGFHAFPDYISGGFVGVDIFFVISGFLISTIILKSSSQSSFSIIDFYSRRIRRIFPALIITLISCLLAGWTLLFPHELKQLGMHALSAIFFVLNFTLWSEAGYFDTASELKPLLHLWSLSIEEQFYTLWPITLIFFIRRGKPALLIATLTLFSFLLCVSGLPGGTANFYMPLSRVWELLCGGLLAYIQTNTDNQFRFLANKPHLRRTLYETCSLVGIFLLGLAIFSLDSKTIFPGWASLLPTLGATILIAAGPTTFTSQYITGNRFFVFIGLISYPLYLWHWPLLSFPKITDGIDISLKTKIISILLTFILATLTYYFFEKPLRHKGNTTSQLLLLAALITALVGALFSTGQLKPKTHNSLLEKISDTKSENIFSNSESTEVLLGGQKQMLYVTGKGKRTILYIGDSNIDQYWNGIEALINTDNSTRKAMLNGCHIPILNLKNPPELDCHTINTQLFAMAANDPDIDTVVLGAQWLGAFDLQYIEGTHTYPLNTPLGIKKAMDQLISSISELTSRGKTVYILLNIPGGDEFEPHNLIKRSLRGINNAMHLEGGITLQEHQKRTQAISSLLIDAARRSNAIILDPADFLCVNNWCSAVTADGEPIYRDADHLRGSYSRYHPEFIGQTLK